MRSPKEILERAKTICDGVWKENNDGGYGKLDEDGNLLCCCVVGAIVVASYGDEPITLLSPYGITKKQQYRAVQTAADTYASCVIDEDHAYLGDIFKWNDYVATKEDVLQGFDCAISKVEA